MANAGAIGTAPVAAFPLGASYQAATGVGSATGLATVSGVGAGPTTAGVGTASGSASVSGVGYGPSTVAAGSASGTSTASGVLAAIAVAVAVASGSASVSGVGAGPVTRGAGTASGSATASATGVGTIATYGALGTSPVAAAPVAGSVYSAVPTGAAYGSSTATGVGVAAYRAVGSASGSASVSGVGAGPITRGVGSASGSASVSGVGYGPISIGVGTASGGATVSGVGYGANTVGVFFATGSASVFGVGVSIIPGDATASGSASVIGVGAQACFAVGTATGSAYAYAIAPTPASFGTAAGSSTAYAYASSSVGTAYGTAIVHGASPTTYQVGVGAASGSATATAYTQGNQAAIGFATGSATANFRSASNATFVSVGTSIAIAGGTYSTSGYTPPAPFVYSFTSGPTGIYVEPEFTGNVCACQNCSPPAPTPKPPTSLTWNAAPIANARVCDLTWAGSRIIIGRAGPLWGGDSCVYLSTSTGRTWSKLPVTPDGWVSVTMSADGRFCGAYPLDTQVTYVSNDYAANWQTYPRPWGASQTNAAEISDDGTTAIVTANPGNKIYLSNNNGVSWTSKDTGLLPSYEFYTASCLSSNGSTMFAGRSLDKMHRSLNNGALWAVCNGSFSSQFSKVACSGDGNNVLATSVSTTGYYQVSHDAGLTWTKGGVNLADNTDGWSCCAVSTNGRVMAVGKYGGRLDVSFDFGVTWTTQNVDGHNGTYLWTDIGINYDGTVIVACAVNGPLYIGTAA